MYYRGEFSLKTLNQDNIKEINAYLTLIGSRQRVEQRRYRRYQKFQLISWYNGQKFIDQIFDLGEILKCRPFNSIVRD